jgi:APA family basic amino acid/polyamine antiporter
MGAGGKYWGERGDFMQLFGRKKSIQDLQELGLKSKEMNKALGLWTLVAIGLGGIIGVGVFVLTGTVAANHAGPAVALSFIVAGLASAAAALCYAEFSGLIPVSGSVYTYSYAVLGEFFAWFIGWDVLLEYTLVVSVVAIGWSGYLQSIIETMGIHLPTWAKGAVGTGKGHYFDLLAALISIGIALVLAGGIKMASRLNSFLVVVKVAIILVVIGVGAFYVDPSKWTPFMPFGFNGVMTGASIVFFAVFGYDTLTTAAEESKNPQRDLPRAVVISLAIALILYVLMALVLTGMVPYTSLDNPAPVANAFKAVDLHWVGLIISVAAVAGITSVIFSFMLGASRIWFSMSRDGLLPQYFAKIHPKYKTPHRTTLIVGLISAVVAGLTPIGKVAELVNIGTLSAFVLICASIMVLRKQQPNLERKFRTPWVPFTPLVGIFFSIWLMIELPLETWIRFVIWLVLGLFIYLFYGRKHSKMASKDS